MNLTSNDSKFKPSYTAMEYFSFIPIYFLLFFYITLPTTVIEDQTTILKLIFIMTLFVALHLCLLNVTAVSYQKEMKNTNQNVTAVIIYIVFILALFQLVLFCFNKIDKNVVGVLILGATFMGLSRGINDYSQTDKLANSISNCINCLKYGVLRALICGLTAYSIFLIFSSIDSLLFSKNPINPDLFLWGDLHNKFGAYLATIAAIGLMYRYHNNTNIMYTIKNTLVLTSVVYAIYAIFQLPRLFSIIAA